MKTEDKLSSKFLIEYNKTHIRKGKNHPMFGKHHSEETKNKIKFKRSMQIMTNSKENGSSRTHEGYNVIKISKGLWVKEHRYVVENYIGRKLFKNERVHHIDGDKRNNSLDNLYIFKKLGDHTAFELLVRDGIINRFILKSNLKEFKIS